MTFGRLVWWVTPNERLNVRTLWCPPRWITPIFVAFDLITFSIQLAGVSRTGDAFKSGVSPRDKQDAIDTGIHILRIGLGLQLICFGLFVLIGVRFCLVGRRWRAPDGVTKWKRLNMAVNGAAGLISVGCYSCGRPCLLLTYKQLRAIYRIFEFTGSTKGGRKNYLNTHEWVFWVCDTIPILRTYIYFLFTY